MRQLLGQVYGLCFVLAVISPVVDRASVHADYHNDADDSHRNLEYFAVLDIAKRKPNTQRTENCDCYIVNPGIFLVKGALGAIGDERNSLVQALCACHVLEAQGSINVDD